MELRVVAGRSRTRASRPHAVSGRPMPIHTRHAAPMSHCAVALRSRCQNGMVLEWHGRVMAFVNQTRPHCVDQMGKTQSEPLAARHGICESNTAALCTVDQMGKTQSEPLAALHGMCEFAFFLVRF
jgi:hypothetical protein